MITKIYIIFLNILPIIFMVGLIPFVRDDKILTVIYGLIIILLLWKKHKPKDILFFIFGMIIMTISEYFFISTGVEIFNRNSLLGIMPLWLPLLWGYSFVVIKRATVILIKY